MPPGAGVEGDESLVECAKREVLEETGLLDELRKITYVREFVEPGYHHFGVFFLTTSYTGATIIGTNPGVGVLDTTHVIQEVRIVRRDEMSAMDIRPNEIKARSWDDFSARFPGD